MALGAQDSFEYAQDFIDNDALGPEVTFLWDPSFDTWSAFGVRRNSEMALLTPDLMGRTSLFYGFGDAEQAEVLQLLPEFA